MIVRLYRTYVPEPFRKKIYNLFLGNLLFWLRNSPYWFKEKCLYAINPFLPKNDYYNAYRFIWKHGRSHYPFHGALKYQKNPIKVLYDNSFPYINHHGKKLYFASHMSEQDIVSLYRSLIIEQDIESPHRYVKSYKELEGKTLLDIGAAEGIFALDTIDYVKKVYLFECEREWIEPLQLTFNPWKDKVEIVEKYVSENNSEKCVTLDTFMKEKEKDNIHIKMDIEGAEQSALKGAKKLLSNNKPISFSVCTYHKAEDAKVISSFFESLGYTYEFTKGYFFIGEPRKGICRGTN